MSNIENILRSISGYILNPANTFKNNRNEGYNYAIKIFVILCAAIFLLLGLLLVINYILCCRPGDPVFLFLFLFMWLGSYGLFCLVEIPVIVFIIHFASKFENRNACFIDSFKIAFVSCAFFFFIIGFSALINELLIIFNINYDSIGLIYFVQFPLYILATLFFIHVSAEGIRTLHCLSKGKSYLIAVISILTAYFAIRLVFFLIMGTFSV